MKTRAQSYGQEAACLLRDITMYRVMTKEQVLRLYPGKREKVQNLLPALWSFLFLPYFCKNQFLNRYTP